MRNLYILLLLFSFQVKAQIADQKLQDVTISQKQPKFVRLKGYYRSYQYNDSVPKYYVDGIVEYYITLKNGKLAVRNCGSRHLRNNMLVNKDRKRAFSLSDQGTFRPWLEGSTYIEECRKKYAMEDSVGWQYVIYKGKKIGYIYNDSLQNKCIIEVNKIPTYDKLAHTIFGFTKEDVKDNFSEVYRTSSEDYYSFKDLLFQRTDQSYRYWYKKDSKKQLIHVITELYITEQEYLEDKKIGASIKLTPLEATHVIEQFCSSNKLPKLSSRLKEEVKNLQYYDPANLNKTIAVP